VADAEGNTPLHEAAKAGAEGAVSALLAAGADPNATAGDGATALHRAAQSGSSASIGELLKAGADPEMRDAEGRTARDVARENDMLDAEMAL
jgi:ankyrin repeat protein